MSTRSPRRLPVLSALVAMSALLASSHGASAGVAQRATASPVYGGTLRIAYSSDFVSLDPAQAAGDDWVFINPTLYNGLYQYDRNGVPQLDLAAAPPTISADRKVWTFHLRKGVRFSNGMEVTANDVKFSITRVIDPRLKPAPSWGQGTDAPLFQGAQAFVAGKAKGVSGIQVLNRYTIRFVLVQPVAVLPDILAESINFVVPQAVVSKESPDYFGSHPVGTGPFMLQSWLKGSQVVVVRNPQYFRRGKPYLDKVVADLNVAPSVIALKIEKGELAGFGNDTEATPADLQQARSDPRYARYLVPGAERIAVWLDLNVHAAPLTSPTLRQAIAMAIDRARLVRLLGGQADPATQLYVPVDPQHDPTLDRRPVYPYDPQRAAALVKASGYRGQPLTILYANDVAFLTSEAPGVQQDLQQIGLNVTLRGASSSAVTALFAKTTGSQIAFNWWGIDFPDAYDIYSGDFTCGASVLSGAHYCNPTADSEVSQAEDLPLGAARNALLRQAQRRILQSASRVPLAFPKSTQMVSPNIGGYYYDLTFGWRFENYWLKR